jgi:hypothetical protein
VCFIIAEGGKVLERVRVKGEIDGKLSNTSVIHMFPLIGELIASLNQIMDILILILLVYWKRNLQFGTRSPYKILNRNLSQL